MNNQRHIEYIFQYKNKLKLERDVTFDENVAYWKSKEVDSIENEEHKDPKEQGFVPSNPSKNSV